MTNAYALQGGGLLQWGRSLSTAEILFPINHQKIKTLASMGPQPFDCGNIRCYGFADAMLAGFNGAAAFRLRKSPYASEVATALTLLQWGRSLSTAEILKACVDGKPAPVLQWGRSLSTAEIFMVSPSFTFGVTLQWGRSLSTAEMLGRIIARTTAGFVLQWGRSLSTAEIL